MNPHPHDDEHQKAARRAGLKYVTDGVAGITRRRAGKGWSFYSPRGTRIADAGKRSRIEALAIPPAWTDVWICPDPKGHIQATGRDARDRKQYRYHAQYREARDQSKFRHILELSEVLPAIRERAELDLRAPELSRQQILATVVQLLDKTLIRVGSDEYAKENRSYGLTTLRSRHVQVEGSRMQFSFRGKSGVQQALSITDRRIARIVQRCQDLPGQELFQYFARRRATSTAPSTPWPSGSETRAPYVASTTCIRHCSRPICRVSSQDLPQTRRRARPAASDPSPP